MPFLESARALITEGIAPCEMLVMRHDGRNIDAMRAPIGKAASTNFGRYSNPATDALFTSYGMTNDLTTQQSIVSKLEKVLLADVPYIPVLTAVSWDQYNSAQFTGWPTAANPYAQGQTAYPDWGWVLLNIKPTS